ncbi:MAG TPA: dihydroorotase [Nevskiaceae bacterium]|nr:dihydroorotase [Nevskiaceae bacterium]
MNQEKSDSLRIAVADGQPIDLVNVRFIDPASGTDRVTNVRLQDGQATLCEATCITHPVDGRGLWLMPGIIDLAARVREPGATHKATMASELPAALAAGITRLCLPPDTWPVVDNPAVVVRINAIAQAAGGAHLHPLGALTQGLEGAALAEMSALKQAGCVGVSNAGCPMADLRTTRRALEYAGGLGLTVHVQPQDASLAEDGCAHDGPVALKLGLVPIPVAAETAALRQWISLAEETGTRIHFGRLSSARGVELVARAKARGLAITADAAAHQLFLTEADIDGFDPLCHVIPPLRSAADRDALRDALRDGTLDALCSDHQPHEADAKTNPFPLTAPGISGLETLLPLALQLVADGSLTPLQMATRLSLAPQRILGLAPTGAAYIAGWLLVDPERAWTVDDTSLRSRGHNTPFLGRTLHGRVRQVFLPPD